jgi:hypothetical protein
LVADKGSKIKDVVVVLDIGWKTFSFELNVFIIEFK